MNSTIWVFCTGRKLSSETRVSRVLPWLSVQTTRVPIPPGADLVFEIEVIDFLTDQEYQTGMMVLQQAMQAQMGGLGAPGGPEGAPPPPPIEIPAQ